MNINAIKILILTIILVLGFSGAAEGQIKKGNRTAFMQHFVTLDTVIESRRVIKLSDNQKRKIQDAVKAMQSEVSDLSWEHESAAQQLEQLSNNYPVDQKAVIAQARRLMEIETKLKLENLKLHVTIKNTLTESQYKMLQGLLKG